MNDEMMLIKKSLPNMAAVFNANPKEVFSIKESETLLVVQGRMAESDLKACLREYNELFAKKDSVTLSDLRKAVISFLKMKVLLERDEDMFSPYSTRELIKEFKTQRTKLSNIIRLSEMNAMTAEDFMKNKIKRTIEKNEAFMSGFDEEIENLEKKLERMPFPEEEDESENKIELNDSDIGQKKKAPGLLNRIEEAFQRRSNKRSVEVKLKDEEKKESLTKCKEIPFYDKSLSYTDVLLCKDIPAYSILKRKNNIFFGLSKNIGKTGYDNRDESLMELTEATEEFLQFLTVDLLSGEYELKPFSKREKEGLIMYFDFVSGCFRKYIGVTLTVQQYLKFKTYYNRLIRKMMELEQEDKEEYYRALILSDSYLTYMKAYDLICSDDEKAVIKKIMSEETDALVDDLNLILENHIVDEEAKEDLLELKSKILSFHDKKLPEVREDTEKKNELQSQPLMNFGMYPQMGMPMIPLVNQGMMQIVIQILNEDREIVDEALYAGQNMKQAFLDYQNRNGFIKRIGFRNNGQDVFCMENTED